MRAIIFMLLILGLVYFILLQYNKLMEKKNAMEKAWKVINTELIKCNKYISELLVYVKGLFEKSWINRVQEMNNFLVIGKPYSRLNMNINFELIIEKIYEVIEKHPEYAKDKKLINLKAELISSQNKIKHGVVQYSQAVADYLKLRGEFPTKYVGDLLGFEKFDDIKIENDHLQAMKKEVNSA